MPNASRLLLFFTLLLLLHCLGNWELPLLDRDEPRFAEASREMLQRGDWIVPYCNGVERFDKPPLIYWVQVASYEAFGDNEFGARFPSAVFAAAAAVILAMWGSRLCDPATGWRAAVIFGLCLQTIVHARSAVADMAMVFCVTLAAWAGWEALALWRSETSKEKAIAPVRGAAWLFWIALAFGFLAKGPIAWVPIGMVGVSAWRLRGKPRDTSLHWWIGVTVLLAIVAAWGVPALIRTHGQFAAVGLGKHVVKRSVFALEGHGAKSMAGWLLSTPYYFVLVFASFFPWSIWLVPSIRDYWRNRKVASETTIYLFTGIVLVFGIFTFSRTKLPHYTLPCFPFLALLLSSWWGERRKEASFRKWAIGMTVAEAALTLAVFPIISPLFPVRHLYRESAAWLDPSTNLAMTGEYQEPSITWYFRKRITPYQPVIKKLAVNDWMAKDGARAVVAPKDVITQLLPQLPADWKTAEAKGYNFVNAKKVDLLLVYKPAPASH